MVLSKNVDILKYRILVKKNGISPSPIIIMLVKLLQIECNLLPTLNLILNKATCCYINKT